MNYDGMEEEHSDLEALGKLAVETNERIHALLKIVESRDRGKHKSEGDE